MQTSRDVNAAVENTYNYTPGEDPKLDVGQAQAATEPMTTSRN